MPAAKKKKGTAGGGTKPKRQAMPGGAPVTARTRKRSTRARKSTRAPKPKKEKPPCKYGPRDADGYCPKKPPSARSTKRNRTKVTARTTDSAVEQGIQVLTNPRASSSQKAEAATTVATTIATDAARKTVRRQSGPIKEFAKKYGATIAGVALPLYIGYKAAQAIPRVRVTESKKFADKELAKTRKAMGALWDESQAPILWTQYFEFALKRPVTNSFLGK